jgi:hypothetical protein
VNAALTSPGAIPVTTNPPLGDASTRIATTLFVDGSISDLQSWVEQQNFAFRQDLTLYAPLASPQFSGLPTAPTANPGTQTAQLATTAFVMNAVAASTAGVVSFNTRTGVVSLLDTDITNAGGALLASPVFSGTPQAPTATVGTDTAQLATCAFVLAELGGASIGVMTFNGRGGAVVLTAADLTSAGGALLSGPAFSGVPTAPTAASGDASQQLATTAFVTSAIAALSIGVASFNSRTGAVTLTANDVTAAGGLANPSPAITGIPTAPTASPGTSTTQLATCAFVMAAIAAVGGVSTFNGRAGAVTLTATDITGAGGAAAAGNRVELWSYVVTSSVANVTMLYTFTTTYDVYEMDIYDVAVASPGDANIVAVVSTNGTTFDTTNGNYAYAGNFASANNTGGAGGSAWSNLQLGPSPGATAGYVGNYNVRIYLPGTTNRYKQTFSNACALGSVYFQQGAVASYYAANMLPWRGLRFSCDAPSNITRGVFKLYGINKGAQGASP